MINLDKIKYEKCHPPLLRRPAPAPYFHPLFKIFQIPPPPSPRGNNSPFKKGGGFKLWHYEQKINYMWPNVYFLKFFHSFKFFFLFNFFDKCCPKILCSPWIHCCMLVKILTFHLIFGDKFNPKICCVPNWWNFTKGVHFHQLITILTFIQR